MDSSIQELSSHLEEVIDPSSPSTPSYVPAAKLSDNFIFVNDSLLGSGVYDCKMDSAASCHRLPDFVDAGITAKIVDAERLQSGDIMAVGTLNAGGNKAIVLLYSKSSGTWTELDRYVPAGSTSSDAHAIALSPSGSIAVLLSMTTATEKFIVTRELLQGQSWTTDSFTLGGSAGGGDDITYSSDESLFVTGTLWDASSNPNAVLRKKDTTGAWSTIETYSYSNTETGFTNIEIFGDKIFLSGWVASSTRQGLLRQCLISTNVCTNLNVSHIGSDTYFKAVKTWNGNDLYFTASTSPRYSLFKFDIAADTLTRVHNYTPDPMWSASGLKVGFGADGRLWGSGRYYDGATDSFRPFLIFYDSTASPVESYVYP